MPALNRTRSMCWTLNNHTPEEIEHIQNGPFKFGVFQQEIGANGTPHLQGYCQMQNPTGFNTWKALISPRAHLEAAKGTPRENYEYCTKGDTRHPGTQPWIKGDVPQPGSRSDIEGLVAMAKDPTKRTRDLVDANGEGFLKFYKGLAVVRSAFSEPRDFQTEVLWFYGSTGTGKSRLAFTLEPNAYWKPGGANWWDGYDPIEHDAVIIDDFRSNIATFSEILRWFDRYPMQVPFKGGYCNFRPSRIYVTTSKHPAQTWVDRSEESLDQLLRRLKVIVEFLPGGIKRFDKGVPADIEGAEIVDIAEPVGQQNNAAAAAQVPHFNGPDEPLWPAPDWEAGELDLEDIEFLHELEHVEV